MKRSVLVLMAVLAIAGLGCEKNKTRVAYSHDAWRVVPVLKYGETIEVANRKIRWIDNPCVENSPTANPCTIKQGLKPGTVYEYECTEGGPCDPEVAVDDPPVITGTKRAMDPGYEPDVRIRIRCSDAGQPNVADASVRSGHTVVWGAFGNDVKPSWQVTIVSADLCEEGAGPFKTGDTCTVKGAPGNEYTYQLQDACSAVNMSTHKIKVIP